MTGGYALEPGQSLSELDMGGGNVIALKVTSEQSRGTVTVVEGVVHQGGPPLHVHEDEDEVVVVLEGCLSYQVGETRGALDAGGVLWFPRQVPHAIANHGPVPARFLTIATPAGVEDFFRAQQEALAALAPGASVEEALAAVPGADRRRVIGPPLAP